MLPAPMSMIACNFEGDKCRFRESGGKQSDGQFFLDMEKQPLYDSEVSRKTA